MEISGSYSFYSFPSYGGLAFNFVPGAGGMCLRSGIKIEGFPGCALETLRYASRINVNVKIEIRIERRGGV